MGFDLDKALREKQEAEKYLTAAEQLERRQEALQRALNPAREIHERMLAATKNLSAAPILEQHRRRQAELLRNLSGLDQFDKLAQRVAEQARSMALAPNTQALNLARQIRESLAAHDAQIAQMSRGILEAMNAPVVGIRFPPTRCLSPAAGPRACRGSVQPAARARAGRRGGRGTDASTIGSRS